ncbi:MAG: hypothetical protein AAGH76_03755 [Pseudomonadota bacterium]
MSYVIPLSVLNACLLVAVAALLWSASRENARREARSATQLETLQAMLKRTAIGYSDELRSFQSVASELRLAELSPRSTVTNELAADHVERLASTATSADELADLTGLGQAEAELAMSIRSAKAEAKIADIHSAAL